MFIKNNLLIEKSVNNKLNWFERLMLKKIANKLTTQDFDHDQCIEGYFKEIIQSARKEFNQDLPESTNAFLKEIFEKALKRS